MKKSPIFFANPENTLHLYFNLTNKTLHDITVKSGSIISEYDMPLVHYLEQPLLKNCQISQAVNFIEKNGNYWLFLFCHNHLNQPFIFCHALSFSQNTKGNEDFFWQEIFKKIPKHTQEFIDDILKKKSLYEYLQEDLQSKPAIQQKKI